MKKFICFLLSVLMVFGLAACAGPAGDTNETQASNPTDNTSPSTGMPEGKALRIYGNIYVKQPGSCRVEETPRTKIFYQDETCLVGITSRSARSFKGKLENMIPQLSAVFAKDVSSFSDGLLTLQKIKTESVERETVAGFDCVRFEGSISNNDGWDCHVYGYVLNVSGKLLLITGLVSDEAQDAEKIVEIDRLTDQIAASIYVKG